MESEGIMPIPVFINGVEAHTVVRDLFTTKSEAKGGQMGDWTLSSECTEVDAIVNTIGFPLVGGPAGSMEGGRQIEVSQQILSVKNIPYIVAAPLLIQDTKSWLEKGVQGLQTVVLFSLPELDGAVDTLVLGGLVDGERITIIPERVRKLTKRLKAWVQLRKKRVEERKVALMVYGFPPNVGAVATAALLNVGSSIRNLLLNLAAEGYFLGEGSFLSSFKRGDQLVKALRLLTQETLSSRNLESVRTAIKRQCGLEDVEIVLKEVPFRDLKSWLGKAMTLRMEKQWGDLEAYTGIGTSKTGLFQVVGLQVGNIFIGIQPALGVEGDPMRLLFERDMTPHPQYAAYYRHIQMEVQPDSIVHFGKERERDSTPSHPLIVVRTIYISIA
jgi:magnesium chelatase subunit H